MDPDVIRCAFRIAYLIQTKHQYSRNLDPFTKRTVVLLTESAPYLKPLSDLPAPTKEAFQKDLEYLAEEVIKQVSRTIPPNLQEISETVQQSVTSAIDKCFTSRPLLHLLCNLLRNLPLFKTNYVNFIPSSVNCNLSRLRILNRDRRNNLCNLYNPYLGTYTHLDSHSEPRSLRTNHLLYLLHLHGLYDLRISYRIGLRKAGGSYPLCHLLYRCQ